jgi:hypothetical protein
MGEPSKKKKPDTQGKNKNKVDPNKGKTGTKDGKNKGVEVIIGENGKVTTGKTGKSPNNDAAEIENGTVEGPSATPPTTVDPVTGRRVFIAPAPLLQLTTTDPTALETVRRRTRNAKANRGRSSLRIPLASPAAGSGGIAIPR